MQAHGWCNVEWSSKREAATTSWTPCHAYPMGASGRIEFGLAEDS